MMNRFNQSNRRPRLVKTRFLFLLAVTAVVLIAPLSQADSGGNQNSLVGTWLKANEPGVLAPLLQTFSSDGGLITTRPIIVATGPTSAELVSTGHGADRTGHNKFTATTILLRSAIDPAVEFTGLVKLVQTMTLNKTGDQLTSSSTLYIYDADNNLLFPPGPAYTSVLTRVNAGQ